MLRVKKAKPIRKFNKLSGRTSGLILLLTGLIVFGSGSYLAFAQTDKPKSWTAWQPPALVLPHAGSPYMLVDSLDGSASYVSSTKGYGVVAGNEFRNWTNSTHIKIGDHTQPDNAQQARATFDEVGTLHAVWGGRSETGTFNVYYNRVLNGTQVNNVSAIPRNLTREIYSTNERPTGKPSIAYSREFHTLYLLIIERKSGNLDDVLLTESTDEGTTWSMPEKVGVTGQFDPSRTSAIILADKNENIHIITAPNGSIVHRVMKGGVLGAEKTVITGSERNFAINAAKAPNGDIWLSWADGQEYGVHAARWSSGNDSWTVQKRLNGNGVQGHYPAIAVGEGTGAIWLMWVDRSQGDSIGDGRDLRTMFTVSHDNGTSWMIPQLMFSFTEQSWYRPNDLSATSSRGLIHLAINAYNRDPNRPWDWSLFITTVPEYYPNQPPPTATPAPTNTATVRPSATATSTTIPNTATATIAAPPATNTPLALSAPGQGNNPAQAKLSPTPKPSDTPDPLANEGASNPTDNTASAPDSTDPKIQATAYALAQAEAAKTPIIVTMPFTNTLSFSGRGPAVLPATATPVPTSTPKPTATTIPTATVKPTLQPTVPLYGAKPVTTTQTVTGTKKSTPAKDSGDPVPMWLVLPLGLVLAGKGALNLLALRKG